MGANGLTVILPILRILGQSAGYWSQSGKPIGNYHKDTTIKPNTVKFIDNLSP